MSDCWSEKKGGERAEHQNVTVSEIDETQDAIHHRVAQRDKRVNGTERETVDQLLEEPVQSIPMDSPSPDT